MFDAAHELICGVTTSPAGTCAGTDDNQRSSRAKTAVVVGLTLDHFLGRDRAAMAEQIGLGLIPDEVLAGYLGHADILAALYDRSGSPLWIGRVRRNATAMQRIALVLRDKACVRCGVHHSTCEVHHLMPWNAPGKGETNLDELVLLCGPCHRALHADNHTLVKRPNGTWITRPATPAETPPKQRDRNDPQRE